MRRCPPCTLVHFSIAKTTQLLSTVFAKEPPKRGKLRATRYLGAIHDLVLLNPIAQTPPARAALAQVNDTLRTVFAREAL